MKESFPQIEAKEEYISPAERLTGNLKRMGEVSPEVLQSEEGISETKKLFDGMAEKIKGFKGMVVEKIATVFGDEEAKNRLVKVLGTVTSVSVLLPMFIQLARTKWPEVGVLLESAPDIVQQFVHMDFAARALDVISSEGSDFWMVQGVEVNNLLADISSGGLDVTALTEGQTEILNTLSQPDLERVIDPNTSQEYAGLLEGGSTVARAFGNTAGFGGAAVAVGAALSKAGDLCQKSLSNNNQR